MAKYSLYVVGPDDQKVPFLRGMLTHSLIEQGLTFKDAYKTANLVRDEVRDRGTISRKKLRSVVESIVRKEFGDRYLLIKEPLPSQPPPIWVRGREVVPFSKGILSQSLQASGLDPQESYQIAMEIEDSLRKKGQFEITRDALRALIFKKISKRHSIEVAERYLLWRHFKAPDKPVIILFGGATGVGKTTVATEIAHRLGIGKILGTDTIRQIMRMMFSRDLLPAIHSSSFEAWKMIQSEDGGEPPILEAFREQTIRVLVGVRAMLERAVQENTSLVVDGVHLVPGLMDFQDLESQSYIVPVVISTLNRANYLERFPTREDRAGARSAKKYMENFESILQIQDYVLEMAENHDVPIIENSSLDETVASILTVITNSLREKLKIDSEELLAKAL